MPRWSAERRAPYVTGRETPRHGVSSVPRHGTSRCGDPHPRLSALRPLSFGGQQESLGRGGEVARGEAERWHARSLAMTSHLPADNIRSIAGFRTWFHSDWRRKWPARLHSCQSRSRRSSWASAAEARPLKWSRSGDALTLDPHAQNEGPTTNVSRQVYEPLVERDRSGGLVPTLALSWRITEDPTVWEFKLRQGVKFHNGNAFDADDVIFTFERARLPTSDFKGYLTSIESVAKVDAHTVRVKTEGPQSHLRAEPDQHFHHGQGVVRGQQRRRSRRTSRTRKRTLRCATPTAPGRSPWRRASPTCAPCSSATTPIGAAARCRSRSPSLS